MRLTFETFGFDHDDAPEADWLADVRDIPASAIDGMEERDGRDPELQARIMETSAAQAWQRKVTFDVLVILTDGDRVAFGCAWGKHRSVAVAEALAEELRRAGHTITVEHRDVELGPPTADDDEELEPSTADASSWAELTELFEPRDTTARMEPMSNPRAQATERQWYEIRNAASSDVAEVYIYDQIGLDWWTGEGVVAKRFVAELQELSASELHLHINSPGGSVFDGVAIYNALARHRAKVTTYIDGLAASIASVIALAGERVIMAENALFMIHNPWGGVQGDSRDMRAMADVLDKIRDTLVGTYEARTGISREALIEALDAETWYDAAEAKAAGFVDEVSSPMRIAASYDLAAFPFRHAPKASATPDPSTGGAPAAGPSDGASETRNTETFIPGLGFARFTHKE